ncbi:MULTISPECIES: DoxX family protein [Paenibacillus]|uniref:DoxX family protein n=1 Tax=Paenibacillus TaxID=44249 RepID=UPI0006769855|nr:MULTISPECIES: hypothetical protein [Paenibacillus]
MPSPSLSKAHRTTWPRLVGLILFAILMISACLYHLREPEGFASMLPGWVPLRVPIIYATAVLEAAIAVLLLLPAARGWTGRVAALYLILIFPANIYAAAQGIPFPGTEHTSPAALWLRLAFQPLLVWWVLWCSRYPFPGSSRTAPRPE